LDLLGARLRTRIPVNHAPVTVYHRGRREMSGN
jgi:hypothetical protein